MNHSAGFLARVWADSRRPLPQPGYAAPIESPPDGPIPAFPGVDSQAGRNIEPDSVGRRQDPDRPGMVDSDPGAVDSLAAPTRGRERQDPSERPDPARETAPGARPVAPGSVSPRRQAVENEASTGPVPPRFGTLVFSPRRADDIRPAGLEPPPVPRPVVQTGSEFAARSSRQSVPADPGVIAPGVEPPEPSPVPAAPVESAPATNRQDPIAMARAAETDRSREYDHGREPPAVKRRPAEPPRLHIGEVRIQVQEEPGRPAPRRRNGRVTTSDSQRLIRSL